MLDWKLCLLRGQVYFENLRLRARKYTFLAFLALIKVNVIIWGFCVANMEKRAVECAGNILRACNKVSSLIDMHIAAIFHGLAGLLAYVNLGFEFPSSHCPLLLSFNNQLLYIYIHI